LTVIPSLTPALHWALKTAIKKALAEAGHDPAQLEAIRASFTTVLQTAVPPATGAVADMAYRAALAAQVDGILAELQTTFRS
jgi:hypothetical protein